MTHLLQSKPFQRIALPIGLGVALLGGVQANAQTPSQSTIGQPTIEFVQAAVERALDFNQGDIDTLNDARSDFTPQAWSEFMRGLEGWLDDNGAPKYGSHFAPSGIPVLIGSDNGIVRWMIPGTLKQSQNSSSTTYRVKIAVRFIESSMKIEHLEVTTCGGASRVAACN